jgi:hypothetical protein
VRRRTAGCSRSSTLPIADSESMTGIRCDDVCDGRAGLCGDGEMMEDLFSLLDRLFSLLALGVAARMAN